MNRFGSIGQSNLPDEKTAGRSDPSLHADTHQHVRGSEQVAEGVVQQVDEGGGVQVGVTHHLGGEQRLSRAAAEKASHHAVAHVHVVSDFLREGQTITMRNGFSLGLSTNTRVI